MKVDASLYGTLLKENANILVGSWSLDADDNLLFVTTVPVAATDEEKNDVFLLTAFMADAKEQALSGAKDVY